MRTQSLRPRTGAPTGVLATVLVSAIGLGYATFALGSTYAAPIVAARRVGQFPLTDYMLGVLSDPFLTLALLLVYCLLWAQRVGPMLSPPWLTRAGSTSQVFLRSLQPSALRLAATTMGTTYAVVTLAAIGAWLWAGRDTVEITSENALLLASQFVRSTLVFTVVATVVALGTLASPVRARRFTTPLTAVAAWSAMFVLASLPDRVPNALNALGLLSVTAGGEEVHQQLAVLAGLSVTLLAALLIVSAHDMVRARHHNRRILAPLPGAWIVTMSAAASVFLASGVALTVDAFYAGYRGTLTGAAVEATLTVGAATAAWLVFGRQPARGWRSQLAVRTGTHTRTLRVLLVAAAIRPLRTWVLLASGATLGIVVAGSGSALRVSLFAAVGGLVQFLLYLVVMLAITYASTARWIPVVVVIMLITLPPPGVRIPWLPIHAAFDSALVTHSTRAALANLAVLLVGLIVVSGLSYLLTSTRDLRAASSLPRPRRHP